jgi:hypothetical protein
LFLLKTKIFQQMERSMKKKQGKIDELFCWKNWYFRKGVKAFVKQLKEVI